MPPLMPTASAEALDAILIDLVDEFGRRLENGESLDIDAFCREHPDHADRLRALLPAVRRLAKLGRSQTGAAVVAAELTAGKILGDFTIVREIGRGGMGIVYEAFQESLARSVALKVLSRNAGANFLQRFRREARVVAKLHHTNIVPIFGIGEDSGYHFFAMQLIQGDSVDRILRISRKFAAREAAAALQEVAPAEAETQVFAPTAVASGAVRRGELTKPGNLNYYRAAANIGLQVAQGLAYAHDLNVLHRDIKPSNVMLDDSGHARLTDFGLAKVEGEDGLTTTGDVVGTLRYMAPERFSGICDVPSDIYGIGATLYEILTLRPIFEDPDRAELLGRILNDAPAPPSAFCPELPADLQTIVLTALAHDPVRRYPSAAALADDLQLFLADRPIKARSLSRFESMSRWCKRYPIMASLAGALTLSLVGGMTGVFWQWRRAEAKTIEARDERDTARKAEREAIAAKERSDANLQRARQTVAKLTQAAGEMFRLDGNVTAAASIHQQAAAIHETFLRENPENLSLLPAAIQQWENLAAIREQLAQLRAAIAAQRRAIELSERLIAAEPDSVEHRLQCASRRTYLARLLAADRQFAEADAIYDQTNAEQRTFLQRAHGDPRLEHRVRMSLGRDLLLDANLQMGAGNDAKALLLLEEAIPLWTTIIAARPSAKESLKASWLAGLADARANARVLLTKASRSREAKHMLLGEIEDCRRLATLLPTQSGAYQLRLSKLEEELAR